MPASEHAQPISRREDALAIARRLVDAGHIAYFAGGCVRDQLLGLAPKDFDVATSAPPSEVKILFPRSQGVGQMFGVLLVRHGPSVIEVATFRADGSYSDGRRPDDVRFATPDEDARRRDFTINGLFFDPLADRVIDLVGGVADLDARVLRAIGDPAARFSEDYLRLLRAVRFAARFDLTIDAATADAIRANIDRLPRIAPERIADELRAILTAPTRLAAVVLLDELRLAPVLLRNIARVETFHARSHPIFAAATAGERPAFALTLVALTVESLLAVGRTLESILEHRSVSDITRALRQTFRLSNDESAGVALTLDLSVLLFEAFPRVAAMKRFLGRPHAAEARRLLVGIAAAGLHVERIAELNKAFDAFAPKSIAPPPLLTGDDLIRAGFVAGPRFKAAIDAAYDAQLEGQIESAAAALEVAKQQLTR